MHGEAFRRTDTWIGAPTLLLRIGGKRHGDQSNPMPPERVVAH
jgi:hypothetical protein